MRHSFLGQSSIMAARQVRFHGEESSVVCMLPNREDFSSDDHEALWFSKSDYHMSRSQAKVISRESARFGLSKNLDDTYSEKNPEAQERLQQWSIHSDSRRGLERWANREHGEVRQQDQFKAIMAVLEAQDELLASSNDGKVDSEKLRKVAHKATKTARQFARMMGKADSHAMANAMVNELEKSSGQSDGESVATENTTRSGMESSAASASMTSEKSIPRMDDDMNDSRHSKGSRFRRFGFGSRYKTSKDEVVSRVA